MSLKECVMGCQERDHKQLGHEHFLLVTRDMHLTQAEREMMLNGWERAYLDRSSQIETLMAVVQAAIDSLDASADYQGEEGWKARFLAQYGLHLDGRRVVLGDEE